MIDFPRIPITVKSRNFGPVPIAQKPFDIDQQSDGGEEEGEEDRLECLDVCAQLTREICSSENDSRDERTQFGPTVPWCGFPMQL